jgi:hypothetical protein
MTTSHEALLAYYTAPGVFTQLDPFKEQVDAVPAEVAAIARTVQGLLIHEGWAPAYGVTLTPDRSAEKQLHGAAAMLSTSTGLDSRPLSEARTPDRRVVGVCRHFATLFVAIARHKGIPARVRAGFAHYFERGKNAEHWVGEYWHEGERRWILVDAQLDDLQRALVKPDFDALDVPRDRFLVAGDAWRACRSGADPMTFGVAGTSNWGLVEVFGEIFQDLAALQKVELLPWGWYGLAKDEGAMEPEGALMDKLADLSSVADATAIDALRSILAEDERLRVPPDMLEAIIASDQDAVAA